jgi:hypothetical protein
VSRFIAIDVFEERHPDKPNGYAYDQMPNNKARSI